MPTKDYEDLELGLIDFDGQFHEIHSLSAGIEPDTVDVSVLDDTPRIFRNEDIELEFWVKDTQNLKRLFEKEQKGSKIICETDCICDGTITYAVQLAIVLKAIGCVCISVRSETVEDANPEWMNCRFIASGIMWNTNNWRRMHEVPMKRRKMKR